MFLWAFSNLKDEFSTFLWAPPMYYFTIGLGTRWKGRLLIFLWGTDLCVKTIKLQLAYEDFHNYFARMVEPLNTVEMDHTSHLSSKYFRCSENSTNCRLKKFWRKFQRSYKSFCRRNEFSTSFSVADGKIKAIAFISSYAYCRWKSFYFTERPLFCSILRFSGKSKKTLATAPEFMDTSSPATCGRKKFMESCF